MTAAEYNLGHPQQPTAGGDRSRYGPLESDQRKYCYLPEFRRDFAD
jgi:hypothetical protein